MMTQSIPQAFIDQLLTRVDIVDVIDREITLKKMGSNYQALCPFHSEKSPSFTVSATKQFYYCFGCSASGNAISFLMKYSNMTFIKAIETLAMQVGLSLPKTANVASLQNFSPLYQLMEKVAKYYHHAIYQHNKARQFLQQRKLSKAIVERFTIGYALPAWRELITALGQENEALLTRAGMIIKKNDQDSYDRFRNRIMFPIRNRSGQVLAFGGRVIDNDTPKYLNSPETVIFHKNQVLYGLYEALQHQRTPVQLLVVEGYLDVLALAQHDIHYVVATLGTAITCWHMQQLFRISKEVIFCFDGDQAGRHAACKAAEIALPLLKDGWQMRFMFLPEGEDPDSLVRCEGQVKFEARIARAHAFSAFFLKYLARDIDTGQLEGRARLVQQALERIKKMNAPIMQSMLIDAVANTANMDSALLQRMIVTGDTTSISSTSVNKSKLATSPLRKAISLLIQHPQLIQHCNNLPQSDGPGWDLLYDLVNLLKQQIGLSTGAIIEYWRDKPQEKYLAKLASHHIMVPKAGLDAEFKDIINALHQQILENNIEKLWQKFKAQKLDNNEKVELQQLIKKSKQWH